MKYKLRKKFPTDSKMALQAILEDRGVEDLENFLHPSQNCELNPYNLEHIVEAAQRLLEHLHKNSNILFVVDCD